MKTFLERATEHSQNINEPYEIKKEVLMECCGCTEKFLRADMHEFEESSNYYCAACWDYEMIKDSTEIANQLLQDYQRAVL